MAAIAAKELKRPVLVNMTRLQVMETTVRRTNTEQRGALKRIKMAKSIPLFIIALSLNLPSETFFEPVAVSTHFLYGSGDKSPNQIRNGAHEFYLNRLYAPGEAVGQLALECAMDELAHALKLCPIELRKRNEPSEDPSKKIPYSTRKLLACMEQGAKAFGWDERPQTPASRLEGDWLIGYGWRAPRVATN